MTRLLEEVVEDVRDLPEDEQGSGSGALLKLLHYLQDDQCSREPTGTEHARRN